jgi:hypothetical protein
MDWICTVGTITTTTTTTTDTTTITTITKCRREGEACTNYRGSAVRSGGGPGVRGLGPECVAQVTLQLRVSLSDLV